MTTPREELLVKLGTLFRQHGDITKNLKWDEWTPELGELSYQIALVSHQLWPEHSRHPDTLPHRFPRVAKVSNG
jgi:hypothetical protein